MSTRIEVKDNTVIAYLSGEIDHHNAPGIREMIDDYVLNKRPSELILDFEKVSFMDSSGIGLVMGRYRLIENMSCTLKITNLSLHAYKVMQLAGLERIAVLTKAKKEDKHNEIA